LQVYSLTTTAYPKNLPAAPLSSTNFAKNHERSTASISLFPVNTGIPSTCTCTKKDDVWISIHPSIHPSIEEEERRIKEDEKVLRMKWRVH